MISSARLILAVAVAFAFVGCRAHVVLDDAPSQRAPVNVRQAVLDDKKPALLVNPGYRYANAQANAQGLATALRLADGTVIEDPRDLAPLVGEDSATMIHANKTAELEERAMWFHGAGLTVATVGLAAMVTGLVMQIGEAIEDPEGSPFESPGYALFTSSTLLSSLGYLFALPAFTLRQEAQEQRIIAFHTYENDLRRRLALEKTPEELTSRWKPASPVDPSESE